MKKILAILGSIAMFIVLLIAMGVGKIVGRGVANSAFAPDPVNALAKVAEQINATLPMMVDSETRLDSTEPGPNNSFNYKYTLVNYSSAGLDPNAVANFTPQVVRKVCGSSPMQEILAQGVTAVYVYRSNDGVEVGRIQVKQTDCSHAQAQSPSQLAAPGSSQSSPAPIAVVSVGNPSLGSAMNASTFQITAPKSTFSPSDTIYLSIPTSAPTEYYVNGQLAVHWTYEYGSSRMTVHDEAQPVRFSGDGTTGFQISKPDGWPAGTYHAEVKLNGELVKSLAFFVQ